MERQCLDSARELHPEVGREPRQDGGNGPVQQHGEAMLLVQGELVAVEASGQIRCKLAQLEDEAGALVGAG